MYFCFCCLKKKQQRKKKKERIKFQANVVTRKLVLARINESRAVLGLKIKDIRYMTYMRCYSRLGIVVWSRSATADSAPGDDDGQA